MKNFLLHYRYLFVIMGLLVSSESLARDYLIEVVLFETVAGRELTEGGLYYPRSAPGSINLDSDAAVQAGFAVIDQGLTLSENAASIAESGRYRLIRHIAWRQPGLDEESAIPVRINIGNSNSLYLPEDLSPYENFIPATASATPESSRQINISTVSGTIRVHLGRFLHMQTNLVYTDATSQRSFRLAQSRKMRSRELHYIDNPRFGLLTRILPLEDTLLPESAMNNGNSQ